MAASTWTAGKTGSSTARASGSRGTELKGPPSNIQSGSTANAADGPAQERYPDRPRYQLTKATTEAGPILIDNHSLNERPADCYMSRF